MSFWTENGYGSAELQSQEDFMAEPEYRLLALLRKPRVSRPRPNSDETVVAVDGAGQQVKPDPPAGVDHDRLTKGGAVRDHVWGQHTQ